MTTQYANASYQEIVDLHTESDTVSVIGIHTPQGDTPRKMFGGFFDQFKKFKYLGCSIKLVPAARLPADPLQVSYDAGEPTIDPRDMLNPLMFHGCHGNDMGVILNRLYALNSGDMNSDSINFIQDDTQWSLAGIAAGEFPNFQLEDLYYKALTDNTWKKAHPQRGFRKSGLRPLVYRMATNLQMLGTGQSLGGEVGVDGIPMGPSYDSGSISLPVTQSGRQFFTPGLTGLGWLDTRNVLTDYKPVEIDLPITEEELPDLEAAIRSATLAQQNASESSLPLVYMGMILLPPAYKTEQYFRMVINHHFAFKDFRGISFSNNLVSTPAYSNFNDEDYEQGGGEVDPPEPGPSPDPDPEPEPEPTTEIVYLHNSVGEQLIHDGAYWDLYASWSQTGETADRKFLEYPSVPTDHIFANNRVSVEDEATTLSPVAVYTEIVYEYDTEEYRTGYMFIDNIQSAANFDVWVKLDASTWRLAWRNGTRNPTNNSAVSTWLSNMGLSSYTFVLPQNGPWDVYGFKTEYDLQVVQ